MVLLLLTQVFVFLWYVSFIVTNYGILPSISDSWYKLPKREKLYFTLFVWGLSIPMLLYGNLWFFLSGVGFGFVGAATQFKLNDKFTPIFHFAGASLGIFAALSGIGYIYNNWAPMILFILFSIVMIIFNLKKLIWWLEILAFTMVVWGLINSL